jgi:hypothetical protein
MNTQLVVSFAALAVLYYIIQPLGAIFQSESNLLQQQQQNHLFIAKLTGNNTIPPVDTTATGISKFYANAAKYNNELYYEIILQIYITVRVMSISVKKTENGPTVNTLYQRTVSLP